MIRLPNRVANTKIPAMVQSSITAWLTKPTTAKRAEEPAVVQSDTVLLPARQVEAPVASPRSVSLEASAPCSEVQTSFVPRAFSLPLLPSNVLFVPLTEDLVPDFKRLNALMLPVPYPPAFYTESMTEPYHGITLMALWRPDGSTEQLRNPQQPRLIGAIRCRLLPSANLYISTLGLLAPYRSHGIATHLLHRIIAKASKEHGVKCVTAHVWEANEDGLEWYKKRGFEIIGKEEGYYRKLKPSGAMLVRKWIGVGDLLADVGVLSQCEG